MEEENTNQEFMMKMKKIKLYPDKEQRTLLNSWFQTSRYVYNKTLEYLKHDTFNKLNKQSLRNKFVTANHKKQENSPKNNEVEEWEKLTPKIIRAQAVFEIVKNYKTAFTNLKEGNIKFFEMKRKKDSKLTDSIGIENGCSMTKNNGIKLFPKFMKKPIKIGKRQTKELKNWKFEHDNYIHFDGKNYILMSPFKVSYLDKNVTNNKIISLDPGYRTFLTGYDPDGKIISYHRYDDKIKKTKLKIDKLKSLREKLKKNFKRKIINLEIKTKNLIDDLHWRCINSLKDYDTVILPNFENQKVAMKSKNKKLNRDIYTYSHYKFKVRLENTFKVLRKKVIIVTEEFTSKTCGNCGILNNNLGSNKIFQCDNCNLKIDRDYNGARNILLKTIMSF
ncbi:MAG: Heterosigma akashiwo virus 01 [Bacteroidota bacterium]|jgi:transposase